jgi:GNAT superfamily N-acetyltransferase
LPCFAIKTIAGSKRRTTLHSFRIRFRISVTVTIRRIDPARDSLDDLTTLLRAAYRPLADRGLNFIATTQDVSVTQKRIESATACWVAVAAEDIVVGTVCYYAGAHFSAGPQWYVQPGVCHFGQFAVSPKLQAGGIGSALLTRVEECAAADRKHELACDTAEPATHLIEFYERRGFRIVERHRWPHAHYDTVVLSKNLTADC